jgi:ATP-dependent protease HslVU (ClpYQ) ATPase subunit
VIEDISFHAPQNAGEEKRIDSDFVRQELKLLMEKADLSKYII